MGVLVNERESLFRSDVSQLTDHLPFSGSLLNNEYETSLAAILALFITRQSLVAVLYHGHFIDVSVFETRILFVTKILNFHRQNCL